MKKNKIRVVTKTNKRSGFFAFLFTLAENISRALKRGPLGYLFADIYTDCNEKWKNGYIYNLFRRKKRKARERATIAHIYEESITSKKISGLSHAIIHSNLRIWGVALLFFAFSTIIVAMIRNYYYGEDIFEKYVLGVILVIISLPLIISRKELGEALISRKLTRFVITDVLHINPIRFEKSEVPFDGSYFVAIMCAVSLGFLSYWIPAINIVNFASIFALFVITMSFPEIGIITLIIALPFANVFKNISDNNVVEETDVGPTTVVLILLGFAACGFISKFLRGKRVMRFELIDVMVLIFSFLLLFGGIFSKGGNTSLLSAEVYFAFLLVYFLIINMYIGKSSIYRAFKVIIVTATLVSIIGIIDVGVKNPSWIDQEAYGDFADKVLARLNLFFDNPNTLGVYLLLVFPLALGQTVVSKRKISKVMYFLSAVAILVCSIKTWSRGEWIGLIVSTCVFLILYDFKTIWLVITGALSFPLWKRFLPSDVLNRIMSVLYGDSSISCRVALWESGGGMIKDNFFTGIGVGESAFRNVYQAYAVSGTETMAHFHNLFLQVLVELGIVGLVVLIIIFIMYSQKCLIEIKHARITSKSRTMIAAGFASIIGVLVMGLVDHVWYNYRVFLMFWIVVALTVALSKANVREKESTRVISNMTCADLDIDR